MTRAMDLRVRFPGLARIRRDPAGFSLLEILISIFIILFGLVGLVSLLPVGRYEMAQTQIYDYSAACGRAGLHEVKARRMLGYLWNGSTTVLTINATVMLDPIGYAKSLGTFPPSGSLTMNRFSLPWSVTNTGAPIDSTAAQRIFRWQDDLVFDIPEGGLRPKQLYFSSLSTSTTAAAGGIVPQNEGNYSWMAMVTPLTNTSGVPTYYYTVSVVVFHKRDFTEPSCGVTAASGTDVTLGGTVTGAANVNALELRENRWILLGWSSSGVYQWYRIVAAEQPSSTTTTARMVSLAGPDIASTPDVAVIPPGVVGVYTETLELDQ